MLRISGRTRFITSIFIKVIITMLVAFSIMISLVLITYRPVYSVNLDGKELGFVISKSALQKEINNYIQYGDSENVGYILLNESPKYEFKLAKKEIPTKEEAIFATIKDSCEVYYRVYVIQVDGKDYGIAENLATAQEIIDKVNEQQDKYFEKAQLTIYEKYEKEYNAIDNIEVSVAEIFEPIKEENDKIIKMVSTPSSKSAVSEAVLASLKTTIKDLNFAVPVQNATITSRYGWRKNGTEFHTGLDLAANIGTPITVAESGIVTCARWSGNYGYLVKVQHAGGYETYYAHCSRFNVKVGDEVKKGDVIAFIGSTGKSTGPHVHLEIRYEGKTLNPQDFL